MEFNIVGRSVIPTSFLATIATFSPDNTQIKLVVSGRILKAQVIEHGFALSDETTVFKLGKQSLARSDVRRDKMQ